MRRSTKSVLVVLVVAGLTGGLIAASAAAAPFSFPFTSNNEGWRTSDGSAAPSAASWASSGGNPGGAISVADTFNKGFGGFFSPGSAGGNRAASFGGVLSFDIKSSPAWTSGNGVAIGGHSSAGPIVCSEESTAIPGLSYQKLEFALEGEEFFGGPEGEECKVPLTDAQMAETLENFEGLIIGGEDGASTGETTTIDNVQISGGAPLAKLPLVTLKAGSGSGSVASSPAGIECGATCLAQFYEGTAVTLTATAASGSAFAGWSGAGCSGTGACKVTLSSAKEVTATFNVVPSAGGSTAPPGGSAPQPKPLTCKKGFKKKRVHGKFKCVKIKHKKNKHH